MTAKRRHFSAVAVGFLGGMALSAGQWVWAEKSTDKDLPLQELRQFTEVLSRIKHDYVEDIDDKSLIRNAIRGMLEGLDPHSAYLAEQDFADIQATTKGEFGGLGIEIGAEDGFVKVVAPIDDTPAAKAGIKAGDLIIKLDDSPVKGMGVSEAVEKMRGEPGTKIKLTIIREGEQQPLIFDLTRAAIKVQSVKSRLIEPGYGYVRISQFQSSTGQSLRDAMAKMVKENGASLNGLVLDLRNNPGGVLNGAVEVSDAFLEKGLIVYTEGRVQGANLKYSATAKDLLDGAPMVVLVNEGSASASEIVAGALQDHKRAVIMGRQTFGKGSVQSILPISETVGLKLTTARYFTPAGRSIQAQGIKPDVELEPVVVSKVEAQDFEAIKEADLTHHLMNNQDEPKEKAQKDTSAPALVTEDYPLYEAVSLLKGIALWKTAHTVK